MKDVLDRKPIRDFIQNFRTRLYLEGIIKCYGKNQCIVASNWHLGPCGILLESMNHGKKVVIPGITGYN